MVDVNKPDYLILPPDFIYSNKFHSSFNFGTSLYRIGTIGEIFNLENGFLWHTVVKMSLTAPNSNIKNEQDIKGFCQSIYGLCKLTNPIAKKEDLYPALQYLDNTLDFLPESFIDTSYYENLQKKYFCWEHPTIGNENYSIISSRGWIILDGNNE